MTAASGLSVSSVQRIWRAHGLRPHQVRSFKLSTDPTFAAKVEDTVGLQACPRIGKPDPWLGPPAHCRSAVARREEPDPGARSYPARSADEEGRAGTMTHDYQRHGTTTWFAALNVLDGTVVGQCIQRHRHQDGRTPRGGGGARRDGGLAPAAGLR